MIFTVDPAMCDVSIKEDGVALVCPKGRPAAIASKLGATDGHLFGRQDVEAWCAADLRKRPETFAIVPGYETWMRRHGCRRGGRFPCTGRTS